MEGYANMPEKNLLRPAYRSDALECTYIEADEFTALR